MTEQWDLYNIHREPLGKTYPRGPLPAGCYHLVVDVITKTPDGKILITKRHPNKAFGGYWEFTGGACQAGETSLQGVQREISEEVGIFVPQQSFQLLGSVRRASDFVDDYLLEYDIRLDQLQLQPEEVVDARLVTPWELDRLCQERVIVPSVACRWYRYRARLFHKK